MITRSLLTVATFVAITATPALAQHRHGQAQADTAGVMVGGGHMMQQGAMMGMMQAMRPRPGALLAAAAQLELSADQRDRLTALQERSSAERQGHMRAAMAARGQAVEALAGAAPDLTAYEEALNEAAGHMVQANVSMARAAAEARDILTTEQREKLHDALSLMHHMEGGMMGGGGMSMHPGGPPSGGAGHGSHR